MGGVHETAVASSTYAPFMWRLPTFTGWNWKCHVIIVIKTDLSGFVIPMHSGLCEQYVKSLRIWLPVSHVPSCIGTTNPSRTGLNPLNNLGQNFFWASSWSGMIFMKMATTYMVYFYFGRWFHYQFTSSQWIKHFTLLQTISSMCFTSNLHWMTVFLEPRCFRVVL